MYVVMCCVCGDVLSVWGCVVYVVMRGLYVSDVRFTIHKVDV